MGTANCRPYVIGWGDRVVGSRVLLNSFLQCVKKVVMADNSDIGGEIMSNYARPLVNAIPPNSFIVSTNLRL